MTELARVAGGKTRATTNWTVGVVSPAEIGYRQVFYLRLKRDLAGATFHFPEQETVLTAEFKNLDLDLTKKKATQLPASLGQEGDLQVLTVAEGREQP